MQTTLFCPDHHHHHHLSGLLGCLLIGEVDINILGLLFQPLLIPPGCFVEYEHKQAALTVSREGISYYLGVQAEMSGLKTNSSCLLVLSNYVCGIWRM